MLQYLEKRPQTRLNFDYIHKFFVISKKKGWRKFSYSVSLRQRCRIGEIFMWKYYTA